MLYIVEIIYGRKQVFWPSNELEQLSLGELVRVAEIEFHGFSLEQLQIGDTRKGATIFRKD